MFTDARITIALETMIHGIQAPPSPLSEIQRKSLLTKPIVQHTPYYHRLAIPMAVVILVVIPFRSPGFVQTLQARYDAAIRAISGWLPPTPAPKSVLSALRSQEVPVATAQSRVSFTIVPPAGLPADVTSEKIVTTPTGVYTKATRSWHIGPPAITFIYYRADGRSFILLADRFDSQSGPFPKYMFETKTPAPNGHITLVKHEHFAWRNGNQVVTTNAGEGISASEIETIRIAMHGVALPLAETPPQLNSGVSIKLYHIEPSR